MRWCETVDGWVLKWEELNIHVQVNYKADSQSQTLVYVQLVMEMMCKQKRVNQWYLQCKVSLLLAAWFMFWISGYPSGSGSGLCLFVTGLTHLPWSLCHTVHQSKRCTGSNWGQYLVWRWICTQRQQTYGQLQTKALWKSTLDLPNTFSFLNWVYFLRFCM